MDEGTVMKRFKYEEGVDYYIKSIYKIPLLSPEEEKELLERVQAKDPQALSRLIQANLRFVINIAKRYAGYDVGFQDLISAGNLGLIEAARRYDPSKGVRFISYAVWWIKQSIHHLLNTQGEMIRKPDKVQSLGSKIDGIIAQIMNSHEKELEIEEILNLLRDKGLDVDEETVNLYLTTKKSYVSLEEHIYSKNEELSLKDILSNSGTEEIESSIVREDLEKAINQILKSLSERERKIIIHRFGLFGEEPKTLNEVGNIVGISRERVRQIEARLLKKLRKLATKRNLRDLLS